MPLPPAYSPAPRFDRLGEGFFAPVEAAVFPEHRLRYRNQAWAERLGLGGLNESEWIDHMARFQPLPENLPSPLATRYHGHQFRNYNPDIGDGRGFLFAQLLDPKDGRLLDLGTKGSGPTPFSRGFDGKLTLKGAVREVLATEMLEAYGVHTSKTFSVIETGESLVRSDEPSPTRAAVLVRLGHSHVRVGNFQYQDYHQRPDRVLELVRYVVEEYYPDLTSESARDLPGLLLAAVVRRAARMAGEITAAGFLHGVLNTDNTNVTGECFDYGPFRFLPRADPDFTAAYFDRSRLYSWARQGEALRWNMLRFAETLDVVCPVLCDRSRFAWALDQFPQAFQEARRIQTLSQLGVASDSDIDGDALVEALDRFLLGSEVAYPRFFFDWYGGEVSRDRALAGKAAQLYTGEAWAEVEEVLQRFSPTADAKLDDAYFRGAEPCSMLIDEVEFIWKPIDTDDDWSKFEAKVEAIQAMGRALGNGVAEGA